ncbi:MAG TPA: hypothetical protein VEQ42_08340, partial [Pyrinomonadaceae bacterium]|nr:hypothetical protein [Pyrinomonadaceae bacterium]
NAEAPAGGNGRAPSNVAPAPTPANAPPAPTPADAAPASAAATGNGQSAPASTNGRRAVDFVCEDDVRRALQTGEQIYVNARTLITPAARDMGESAEVFAKA